MALINHRFLTALVCVLGLAGCSSFPTLLDPSENSLTVGDNEFGSNGRAFHKILHYPNAVGLRYPGFIVGIEKAKQRKVSGPKVNGSVLVDNLDELEKSQQTGAYGRLKSNSKAHIITHVTKYTRDEKGIFPGRIVPCTSYSLVRPDGRLPSDSNILNSGRLSEEMGQRQFPTCDDWVEFKPSSINKDAPFEGAYVDGWRAVKNLRTNLVNVLCGSQTNDPSKSCTPDTDKKYSHVIVIVMGWNTPQDNAVENFNSIAGHLIDEVESQRRSSATGSSIEVDSFRPLVIGITWASDWQLSEWYALPVALVRGSSFKNKADDAREIGVSWLNALVNHAILPARAAIDREHAPSIIYIGHSFGARATLASLTKAPALKEDPNLMNKPKPKFQKNDRYIALQAAFQVEEILKNEDDKESLHPNLVENDMRTIITTSAYDSANEKAIWGEYAGQIKGHDKVCSDERWPGVECAQIAKAGKQRSLNYGYALCDPEVWGKERPLPNLDRDIKAFSPDDWLREQKKVLFLDISRVANCRAAFTGGGSHSDIYRRETARMMWDLIRPDIQD